MLIILLISSLSVESSSNCKYKSKFDEFSDTYPFSLMALPYCYFYLSSILPDTILHAHHDHHHQTYVDKLNDFLEDNEDLQSLSLVELQSEAPSHLSLEKYAGGDYNHRLYWWVLASESVVSKPSGELLSQLEQDFGSFVDFQKAFEDSSNDLFGTGWTWACTNSDNKIEIRNTEEQVNPLMADPPCYPFLANDIWEHAYYLQYKWQRDLYISDFWKIVDWDVVSEFYSKYANQGQAVPLG